MINEKDYEKTPAPILARLSMLERMVKNYRVRNIENIVLSFMLGALSMLILVGLINNYI